MKQPQWWVAVLLALYAQGCGGSAISGPAGMGGEAGAAMSSAAGSGSGAGGATAAVAGAPSAGGDSSYEFYGSCTFSMDRTCVDHPSEPGLEAAYQAYLCTTMGGTWAAATLCPAADRIGGCSVVSGDRIVVTWYYDAAPAADAKATCVGSWIFR